MPLNILPKLYHILKGLAQFFYDLVIEILAHIKQKDF